MTRIRKIGESTVQQHMDGGAVKLSTFIPLKIKKRGVRKVVIRPDGESAGSTTRNQFDSPMLVALARASIGNNCSTTAWWSAAPTSPSAKPASLYGERTAAPDPAGARHHPRHPGWEAA